MADPVGAERRLKAAVAALAREKVGPALDWTDDELDALAAISAADVQLALAFWRAEAPALLKTLLDAEPWEG